MLFSPGYGFLLWEGYAVADGRDHMPQVLEHGIPDLISCQFADEPQSDILCF